jgi:hypothetical protein
VVKEHVAFELASGFQASYDVGDLKMQRIGMYPSVEGYSASDNACADVGGIVGMNCTVDAELALMTLGS